MTKRAPFQLLASALFVSFLAVNCVVETTDAECDEGDLRECTCSDGSTGVRRCDSDGEFGRCVCEDGSAGSSGSSGTGGTGGSDAGGAGGTTAGAPSVDGGADGDGGAAPSGGGAGGADAGAGGATPGEAGRGGSAGDDGQAGAGGAGEEPLSCEGLVDDPDECDECLTGQCCAELTACLSDDTCLEEFSAFMSCVDELRETATVTPEEAADCAAVVSAESWPGGLTSETVTLLNCMAGDSNDPSWSEAPAWGPNACRAGCFAQP